MKAIFFIALIVISTQASKLASVTKVFEGYEKATDLDLGSVIDCLDEKNSKVLFKVVSLIINYSKDSKKANFTTFLNLLKSSNDTLKSFGDCLKENADDVTQ